MAVPERWDSSSDFPSRQLTLSGSLTFLLLAFLWHLLALFSRTLALEISGVKKW